MICLKFPDNIPEARRADAEPSKPLNGPTEGFHTKMEMMSRRAYGFRNFENYTPLRVGDEK
jgi:hypothetical protein